jgi:hypothetical protein
VLTFRDFFLALLYCLLSVSFFALVSFAFRITCDCMWFFLHACRELATALYCEVFYLVDFFLWRCEIVDNLDCRIHSIENFYGSKEKFIHRFYSLIQCLY